MSVRRTLVTHTHTCHSHAHLSLTRTLIYHRTNALVSFSQILVINILVCACNGADVTSNGTDVASNGADVTSNGADVASNGADIACAVVQMLPA